MVGYAFPYSHVYDRQNSGDGVPHYFIDVMVKGPFKSLWHKHSFIQQDGYTIMKDEFIIEAPLGILGRFAEWLFLKSYMEKLLIERNRVLKNTAEMSVKPYIKAD